MKIYFLLILPLFLVSLSGFSQVESRNNSVFENKLLTNRTTITESLVTVKTNNTTFLTISKNQLIENWNSPRMLFLEKNPVNNWPEVLQKINDYKFNYYSCSAQYISGKDLLLNMLQDEVTNYLLHKF